MALQGTLDTFELPDVLRLLASTRKSGRLTLRSDRGTGDVWLRDGQVVGVAAGTGATSFGDGVFELLRAREGAFAFEPGEVSPDPSTPADVEPLLVDAEEQLAEWRAIEAVVPSLASWVALEPELAGPEVTVDAATWRLVATIGSGLTVAELGAALGLDEVPVSRVVRDLVGLGLGSVVAAPAHAAQPPTAPAADAVEPAAPLVARPSEVVPEVLPEPAPEIRTVVPLFGGEAPVAYDEPVPAPPSPFETVVSSVADPAEADEVARQLAMLSPAAAQAIAAAAVSSSDDDRQAALDALDEEREGDEPVNRGLLLKFLSSVKA